ncbi:MAG: hypothetical protein ACOYNC_18000 [Bacteroidales bacterium]
MELSTFSRPFACLAFFAACFMAIGTLQAQDEKVREDIEAEKGNKGATFSFGADLMSRFVWRGIDYGNSPAIQPNLSFAWNGLNIGAWGSYAFSSHSIRVNDTTVSDAGTYAETDLFISYTYQWFTLMVFDYFTEDGLSPNTGNRYFDYSNSTTGHTLEGSLAFDGPEKFPLQVLASTLFYGADKDDNSKNNYSTYIELAYKINLKKIGVELRPFIGGIPFKSSWYGPSAGITNLGLTAKKEIAVTTGYSLPVQVSLVTNPQAQSVFFIFGISF